MTLHRLLPLPLGVAFLLAIAGCGSSESPAPSPQQAADPLARLLSASEAGEIDTVIEILLNHQGDWLTEHSPPEMRLSESDLAALSHTTRSEQIELMLQRATQLKVFSRAAVERAAEMRQRGETERAQQVVAAVQQLGQQLADADIALVLQQTGKALTQVSLPPEKTAP